MKIFLNFFFSDKFESLRPEIIKYYDSQFIESQLFSSIKDKYLKIQSTVVQITENNQLIS